MAEEVFWYHGAKGVYAGRTGGIFDDYKGRVIVETNETTGACNLIIPLVQPADSGKYNCKENEGIGKEGSAQLIVLGKSPLNMFTKNPRRKLISNPYVRFHDSMHVGLRHNRK